MKTTSRILGLIALLSLVLAAECFGSSENQVPVKIDILSDQETIKDGENRLKVEFTGGTGSYGLTLGSCLEHWDGGWFAVYLYSKPDSEKRWLLKLKRELEGKLLDLTSEPDSLQGLPLEIDEEGRLKVSLPRGSRTYGIKPGNYLEYWTGRTWQSANIQYKEGTELKWAGKLMYELEGILLSLKDWSPRVLKNEPKKPTPQPTTPAILLSEFYATKPEENQEEAMEQQKPSPTKILISEPVEKTQTLDGKLFGNKFTNLRFGKGFGKGFGERFTDPNFGKGFEIEP